MRTEARFAKQPRSFWAAVKLVSEQVGYSKYKASQLRTYSIDDVKQVFKEFGLRIDDTLSEGVLGYLNWRSGIGASILIFLSPDFFVPSMDKATKAPRTLAFLISPKSVSRENL